MSENDGTLEPGAVYVTLQPDLNAAVERIAAATYSTKAQAARALMVEALRARGELPGAQVCGGRAS